MGKALKLVYLDPKTKKFIFDEQSYAEMFLSDEAIKENIADLPVAVVSINGDCRKGKSFLLNFFLRYLQRYDQENWIGTEDEPLTGFPWSDGVERETDGIVVWSKPFILTRSDGKRIAVLLMDTQGFFDDVSDHKTVEQFYSISSFISSIQICNQWRNIQSNDITILSKFNEFAVAHKERTGLKPFQKILFLLRDWPNRKEFDFGLKGGREFLSFKKKTLETSFGGTWSNLHSCFSEIDCFLMSSPGDAIEDDEFRGEIGKLKPAFVECLKELIPSLISPDNIIIKSWEGKGSIKLWETVNIFKELIDQLIAHGSINIEDLETINNTNNIIAINNAFLQARKAYLTHIAKKQKNNKKEIQKVFDNAEALALDIFEKNTTTANERNKDLKQIELINFFADFRETYSVNTVSDSDLLNAAKASSFNFNWKVLLSPIVVGAAASILFKVGRIVLLKY